MDNETPFDQGMPASDAGNNSGAKDYADLLDGTPDQAEDGAPGDEPDSVDGGDGDTESEAGGDEATDSAEPQEGAAIDAKKTYKIGDQTLTGEELVKGHMLHADYTRKTQELAFRAARVEAEAAQIIGERQRETAAVLQAAMDVMQAHVMGSVTQADLARMAHEDPGAWVQHQQNQQRFQQLQNYLYQQAGALLGESQKHQQYQHELVGQQTQQVIDASLADLSKEKWFTPDWKKQALAFLMESGIPEQEAHAIHRSGAMRIVRDAMLFRDAQKRLRTSQTNPAAAKPAASAQQGGMNKSQRANAAYTAAMKPGAPKATKEAAYAALIS